MTDQSNSTGRAKPARSGGYMPSYLLTPAPVFVWPPQPRVFLRWFFGIPGYLLPWHLLYTGVPVLTWFFLSPELATMKTFGSEWVAFIYIRNAILLAMLVSAWHVPLYVKRWQGLKYKYDARWPTGENPVFLFNNQMRDNLFWTFAFSVPIWTGFECFTYWGQANGYFPAIGFREHPVYSIALLLALPLFRDAHFYIVHRILHWPPLYRLAHKVHHNNVNAGPWSGLAMHPVECFLYFTSMMLHWVVPSHPFHVLLHAQNLAFVTSHGHLGFDEVELGGGRKLATDSYMHYLHHKYFEVNYGLTGLVPLDDWLGTMHDGSPDGEARMNERLRRRARGTA